MNLKKQTRIVNDINKLLNRKQETMLKKSNKIKSGFFKKSNQMVGLWQD